MQEVKTKKAKKSFFLRLAVFCLYLLCRCDAGQPADADQRKAEGVG